METLEFSDLTITPLEVECEVSRYDLAVFLWDMPEGLSGTVEYCVGLFEPATITRMIQHFEAVLRYVVVEPDIRLNELVQKLNEVDRQKQISKDRAYKDSIHRKLKNIKRKSLHC